MKLKMQGKFRRIGHGFAHEYRDPTIAEVIEWLQEQEAGIVRSAYGRLATLGQVAPGRYYIVPLWVPKRVVRE